ncbi:MAG TPA: cytochrome c [Chthoniobacteraceae bacterium]|nr:cytochrome c [Chthoniobacteraceae bacterium]
MSINAQKYLVGIMGLILLCSIITAGYLDDQRRKRENPAATVIVEPPPPLSPELQRGYKLYTELSCVACHGADGKGGVHNLNSQTGQQVPALIHVADSYTQADLIKKIQDGVPVSAKLNADGPTPPLHMPSFKNLLNDQDMDSLVKYLISLKPAQSDNLGF